MFYLRMNIDILYWSIPINQITIILGGILLVLSTRIILNLIRYENDDFENRPGNILNDILTIPELDYGDVIKHIDDASAPASIGMINLGLYTYMSDIEQQLFYSPESYFLFASLCYFGLTLLIVFNAGRGKTLEHEGNPGPGRYQVYFMYTLFLLAAYLDLIGLLFLIIIKVS